MPRRKSLYRARMAAEAELSFGEGRPLALPDGVPATIEVGMGTGRALAARAAAEPGRFFVGVELKEARAWRAVRDARAAGCTNVRIAAVSVAAADLLLPTGRFDELVLLFPDPWPKERDEARRLIAPRQLRLYARWLAPGASGLLRTDAPALFAYAQEALAAEGWTIVAVDPDAPPPAVPSRYEVVARARGAAIGAVRFVRPAGLPIFPAEPLRGRVARPTS